MTKVCLRSSPFIWGRKWMFLVELVRIVYVVPDAVKAASQCRERVEEGVTHPNGQDGVLLPTCLCGTDVIVIMSAYPTTYNELNGAGQSRT